MIIIIVIVVFTLSRFKIMNNILEIGVFYRSSYWLLLSQWQTVK